MHLLVSVFQMCYLHLQLPISNTIPQIIWYSHASKWKLDGKWIVWNPYLMACDIGKGFHFLQRAISELGDAFYCCSKQHQISQNEYLIEVWQANGMMQYTVCALHKQC